MPVKAGGNSCRKIFLPDANLPTPPCFHVSLESVEQKEKQALSWSENFEEKERLTSAI